MQSYQNVSNSQLLLPCFFYKKCCKRFCKVIKMLAIHNYKICKSKIIIVANAYAKLSKCQQFTTCLYRNLLHLLLQTLMQSYQNVSNSQLVFIEIYYTYCCKRLCKVIKMLAIHNRKPLECLMWNGCKRLCKVIKMLAIHNQSELTVYEF